MISNDPIFLEPHLWGQHFWFAIECVILAMDVKEKASKESVYLFLMSLQNTLPCPDCRNHYQDFCYKNDPKQFLHSKETLFRWIYALQREINSRNNKPSVDFNTYINRMKHQFQLL